MSLSFLSNTSTIFFDTLLIEKQIKLKYPQVKKVSFTRLFPATLVVGLSFYTPLAQIVQPSNTIVLGENTTVLKVNKKEDERLPRIYYYQLLPQHEQKKGFVITRQDIVYAFTVLQQHRKFGLRFNTITIARPGHFSFTDEEKKLTVLLSSQKTIDKNAEFVHNSVKGLTVKGIKPRIINVEFDQPIITL
ncbi:MAG: hypothetical protein AAB893_01155 [Patescibacteria group bacterium]